ncbi:hypothetical protein [Treponema phagedenis]|uniref:hypothetical protein n=1 Tax=Treponema phagedenis TaxID=162 RepID=UPI0015A06A43|nr:hypothetical protein [Treponema phagedenis]NVP25195.1 hypothetical protein [Treponema phagedenis]QLC59120.1 hypothetical protein HW453_10195 [Treponema phagedenis]
MKKRFTGRIQMQNPFRIVLKMLTVSLFAAELVSCNQFRADIETDFAYWTQQAMVTQADFTFVADAETVPSVHSKADAVLTLKVRDPQSYTLSCRALRPLRRILLFLTHRRSRS